MKFEILKDNTLLETLDLSDGTYPIGRLETNSIVLNSSAVSKKHATLVIQRGNMAIIDEGSSNGTFLNGILVKKQNIHLGDKIQIGDYSIRIPRNQNRKAERQTEFQNEVQESPILNNESIPVEPKISPLEKFFIPLDELMSWIDIRIVLGTLLVALFATTSILTIIPFQIWGFEASEKEALERAHSILRQIARDNALSFSKSRGDFSNFTVDLASESKGFLETLIIEPTNDTILAPQKLYGKSVQDPYALTAIKKIIEDKNATAEVRRNQSVYVVAAPIYGNSNLESLEVIGVVVADFELSNNFLSTVEPTTRSILISIMLSLVALAIATRMLTKPLQKLTEQVDFALKGEGEIIATKIKFPPLEELSQAVNFAISKVLQNQKSSTDFSSSSNSEDSENSVLIGAVTEMDKVTSDAILLLSREKKVVFIGKITEELVNMRTAYARGQNISDASRDPSLSGTIIELTERILQSFGEAADAQLEINGVMRNMHGAALKNESGQIQYFLICIQMAGNTA